MTLVDECGREFVECCRGRPKLVHAEAELLYEMDASTFRAAGTGSLTGTRSVSP